MKPFDRSSRQRIINHVFEHRTSERIGADLAACQSGREVAATVGVRGNGSKTDKVGRYVPEHLVIEEEERAVVPVIDLRQYDRSTEVCSQVMPAQLRSAVGTGSVAVNGRAA